MTSQATFDPLAPPDQIPFFTKLQTIVNKFDPSGSSSGLAEAGIAGEGSLTTFDALLDAWGANTVNPALRRPFPRTWADFVNQTRLVLAGQSGTDTNSGPIFDGFYQDFLQILQASNGDLAGLSDSQLRSMFIADFSQFLNTFPFNVNKNPDGSPGIGDGAAGPLSYFISQWHKFMTVTALNTASLATGNYSNVSVYQTIFQAFFPEASNNDFITLRNELIAQMQNSQGYFLPSHMLSEWYALVQNAYLTAQLGATVQAKFGTNSDKIDVLWKVFSLAVQMIGTLQNVAAAQAGRLNFLTKYQKAYTELMANIPVFTRGDSSPFSGTSDTVMQTRQELNPKNQIYTQNLQSFRDQLSDQAKAVQANINQLNDSVNQQSSLADTILQQMATILQSIFR